jgi:alcohol dehydrogenase class IV
MTAQAWRQDDVAQRVRFGDGALDELPGLLRELGVRRVLLVTSQGRRASEAGQRLERMLGRTLAATFAGVEPHLPAEVVDVALRAATDSPIDGLVSLGGGSVIDAAKAVAFFVELQAGTPGRSVLDRPATVHVAVPTTFTPTALTGTFTMVDPHTRTKGLAGSPTAAPSAVVYEPGLLADLSPSLIAGTALDALAAALHGAFAADRSPETEALAIAASQRIAGVLPLAVDDPDDALVRADLLEGAAMASRVLQRTGPGPHQALAQLLGGRTGGPHGTISAVLLPRTLRWQAAADPAAASRVAEALGADDPAATAAELLERVGVPAHLGTLGVDADDLAAVARLSQAHPGIQRQGGRLSEAEVADLLAGAA